MQLGAVTELENISLSLTLTASYLSHFFPLCYDTFSMALPQPGPTPSEITATDIMQLDILVGLRIMEELGKARPSPHDIHFESSGHLVQVINWLTLCLVRDVSSSYHDIAASISTEPGCITVHLTKGSGVPPTPDDLEMTSIFLGTLRRVLYEGLIYPNEEHRDLKAYKHFLWMLAENIFPAFNRKLALIGTTEENDPQQTFGRFQELVGVWLRCCPAGEQYSGFINLARERGDNDATDIFVQAIRDIIEADPALELAMVEEKYIRMNCVLKKCVLVVNSTFFADVVNQSSAFNRSLESFDGSWPSIYCIGYPSIHQ